MFHPEPLPRVPSQSTFFPFSAPLVSHLVSPLVSSRLLSFPLLSFPLLSSSRHFTSLHFTSVAVVGVIAYSDSSNNPNLLKYCTEVYLRTCWLLFFSFRSSKSFDQTGSTSCYLSCKQNSDCGDKAVCVNETSSIGDYMCTYALA